MLNESIVFFLFLKERIRVEEENIKVKKKFFIIFLNQMKNKICYFYREEEMRSRKINKT